MNLIFYIFVICNYVPIWTQLWPQQAILSASNKRIYGYFGTSVAIVDNYALVGASATNPGSVTNAGTAFIFFRSGGTWSEQAILTASNKSGGDYLGSSAALTENYALVGAIFADPNQLEGAGAAYIFARSGTLWTEQAFLTASNIRDRMYFSQSVSITDNFALIGAYKAKVDTINEAGAAYLFTRSGVVWTEIAILSASDKSVSAFFGTSASLTDNYALVGAKYASPGSVYDAGAAYIFSRSGATWTEQIILTASNKARSDYFGTAASLTDDYALVGASQADVDAISDTGAAYIFSRSGTSWTEQAILTSSGKKGREYFGVSVSLTNNFALVGTDYYSTSSSTPLGAAYMFGRSGVMWTEQAVLRSNNEVTYENFGECVSMTDKFAIIASTDADLGALVNAGAAYIFNFEYTQSQSRSQSLSQSVSSSPEPLQPDILAYQSTRTGKFGSELGIINNTLVISSPTCIDQSRCDGGRSAVFKKDVDGDWMVVELLQGRHRNIDAMFGYSLDVSNYWLAITSKGTSYHEAQTALVSIFGKNPDTDTIERVAGLRPKSNNQQNMDFGHSVAVGQFDIIVGVPGYDLEISIDIGAIMSFRFRISINRWGRNPAIATAFDAVAGDRYGHSVSFDESFLAVGNNPSDNTRYAVYILTKSGFEFVHFYKISGNGKRGFGWKVLLSEDELIVGSPQDDNGGASTNGGCVSIFAKNSTNHFVEYDTIRHTPYVAERRFGFAVARKGDRMAIGTNTCPNGAPCALKGKAYLYTKSGQQWVPRRSFSSGHVDGSDSFGTRVTIDEDDFVVGAPNSNNGSGRVYAYYVPEISG